MSNEVKVTINGIETMVPEGTYILDAAEMAGVHIPNLCYLKGTKGVGACRLCLVQVEGSRGSVIACNTKVKDGMSINTHTDEIVEQRKFVIDLILSMHPLDCMTCTKAGVCNLQQYAYDFGIKKSSYTLKDFNHTPETGNPFIKLDPDYCVLCGRCVRMCGAQGTNVLEFMGRGVGSKIGTAVDKPMQESGCTFCGSCVDVCPVNCILEADRWRKGREWDYDVTPSVCLSCGDACETFVSTMDGRVQKINAGADDASASKYICAIGRFGYDAMALETKASSAQIGGKDASYADAVKAAAEKLKAAGKEAGIAVAASVLNEDAATIRKFAADIAGTRNCDSTVGIYADPQMLLASDTVSVDQADVIVAVGLGTSQHKRMLPALDASIKKMAGRGAKVIIVNSGETSLDSVATVKLDGDEGAALKALSEGKGSEEAEKAVALLGGAASPIVYVSPALFDAALNLNAAIVCTALESNARGVTMMGLVTGGKSYAEMAGGACKTLYVIGDVPMSERPKGVETLIVQNSHMTSLAAKADVFLPSVSALEACGTIVDYQGQIKCLCGDLEHEGDVREHWRIVTDLAQAMGRELSLPTGEEIKAALEADKAERKAGKFERARGFDVDAASIMGAMNATVMSTPRMVWLSEAEKGVKA